MSLVCLLKVCSATDGHDTEGILRLVLLEERTAGEIKRALAIGFEYGLTSACTTVTLTSTSEDPGKTLAISGKLYPRCSKRIFHQHESCRSLRAGSATYGSMAGKANQPTPTMTPVKTRNIKASFHPASKSGPLYQTAALVGSVSESSST